MTFSVCVSFAHPLLRRWGSALSFCCCSLYTIPFPTQPRHHSDMWYICVILYPDHIFKMELLNRGRCVITVGVCSSLVLEIVEEPEILPVCLRLLCCYTFCTDSYNNYHHHLLAHSCKLMPRGFSGPCLSFHTLWFQVGIWAPPALMFLLWWKCWYILKQMFLRGCSWSLIGLKF